LPNPASAPQFPATPRRELTDAEIDELKSFGTE
jgi:hypothetical protein